MVEIYELIFNHYYNVDDEQKYIEEPYKVFILIDSLSSSMMYSNKYNVVVNMCNSLIDYIKKEQLNDTDN